ncbi:putative zinc-containing alcohol dehydrogenase [Gordonia amarae NBRC 15530]|uniref:Putative zinc-containing alcohol dehydrogenase n=1 Tax=Gordonia amarae NBRC 15530 TaxID=1075090 RepID=G7GKS4_9ACTN|nr:putative zinc-containing alcohol dehydrogenase [Gordonia amarae NBRC 15530]
MADQGTHSRRSLAYAHEDFVGAISAITQKRLDVLALHTATIGLGELAAMFEELDSGTTEHTKVLVDPRR